MKLILVAIGLSLCCLTKAAQLQVQLTNAPTQGQLVFQIYDSADAFGDFRDPAHEFMMAARGPGPYKISDLDSGRIVLLVYLDENNNGLLDRNFIGIPRERLAMSNNYRPKGPPSFDRASFDLMEGDIPSLEVDLFRVLGKRGQWGLGLGAIAQSSPYVRSDESVFQLIPAVTYAGERFQWFGPRMQYGLVGAGDARLAVSAQYRIGRYDDEDSEILNGLGDRKGTLMAGLSLQYELPKGIELQAAYQHDALDRIGGGAASLSLTRGFQYGSARLSPELSISWLSAKLSNHDYGVPITNATDARPAYDTGSTVSLGLGMGAFVEVSENWRLILNLTGQVLDDNAKDSPIVGDDFVFSGFGAFTYLF